MKSSRVKSFTSLNEDMLKTIFKSIIVFSGAMLYIFSNAVLGDTFSGDQYGPFNYADPAHRANYLPIVEKYHFNSDVEKLRKGITGTVWEDLDYTIRIFPNHHRALYSMARLYRLKGKPVEAPPEKILHYYFDRAISHYPNDPMIYMIYGIHYHKMKKYQKSEKLYLKSISINPDVAESHYNLGLLYVVMGNYDKAAKHAEHAYNNGYPLEGLKNKLEKHGKVK